MTCPSCQERLLEYVYGLLDENHPQEAAELAKVRAHLDSCPICQASYQRALGQQKLLGLASTIKTSIRFSPPQAEPVGPTRVQQVALSKKSHIVWYATVASLLLAVLLGSGGFFWWGVQTKWKPVELAQHELNQLLAQTTSATRTIPDLQKEMDTALDKVADLASRKNRAEMAIQNELKKESPYLTVAVPSQIEAGGAAQAAVRQNTISGKQIDLTAVKIGVLDGSQRSIDQKLYANERPGNQVAFELSSKEFKPDNNYHVDVQAGDSGGLLKSPKLSHPLQALRSEYVAHLCTDKPLYQPGEEVFYRLIALDKATFRPVKDELQVAFTLQDSDGKAWANREGTAQIQSEPGQYLKDLEGRVIQGVAAASYRLPQTIPGGQYTLLVKEKTDRFSPQQVKFLVNAVGEPLLDKHSLRLDKLAYVPGDVVELSGVVRQAKDSAFWAHGSVSAGLLIDGTYFDEHGKPTQKSYPVSLTTDAAGQLKLRFTLPRQIQTGHATLSLKFTSLQPAGQEIWTQPVRLELNLAKIEFFPEGGDLIAGLPNRVYFQMRNSRDEPIDGKARLISDTGQTLSEVKTFRDETHSSSGRGMGSFSFTPRLGQTYRLVSDNPAIEQQLPVARDSGVVLSTQESVLPGDGPVQVQIANAGKERELLVAVYCRGQLLGMQWCSLLEGQAQRVQIPLARNLGGVHRITVFEPVMQHNRWEPKPLAERLIYRQPYQNLQLNLAAQPKDGNQIELRATAKTPQRPSSPAYVTIVGVNQAVSQVADESTSRKLPTHFLLAQEVRYPEDLENADFFLLNHPAAKHALDLLLGTQGWRRFKEVPQIEMVADYVKPSWKEQAPAIFDNRHEAIVQSEQEVRKRLEAQHGPLLAQLKEAQTSLDQAKVDLARSQEETSRRGDNKAQSLQMAQTKLAQSQSEWHDFKNVARILGYGLLGGIAMLGGLTSTLVWSHWPRPLALGLMVISGASLVGIPAMWLFGQPQQPEIVGPTANPNLDTLNHTLAGGSTRKGTGVQAPFKADKAAGDDRPTAPAQGGASKTESIEAAQLSEKDERQQIPLPTPTAPEKTLPPAMKSIAPEPKVAEPSPVKRLQVDSDSTRARVMARGDTKPGDQTAAYRSLRRQDDGYKQKVSQELSQIAQNQQAFNANVRDKKDRESPTIQSLPESKGASGNKSGLPAGRFEPSKLVDPGAGARSKESMSEGKTVAPGAASTGSASGTDKGGFILREYAWPKGHPPAALQPSAWSQTVYWNPMVVLTGGEWTTSLRLPMLEGVYRFQVFGHDGEGRLGAASLDVKTPVPLVTLHTKLSHEKAKVGDVVQLAITLRNVTKTAQSHVIAKVLLPQGVTLPPNTKSIKALVSPHAHDAPANTKNWSIKDNELTILYEELKADQQVKFTVDLVCRTAGMFQSGPSRSYPEAAPNKADQDLGLRILIEKD